MSNWINTEIDNSEITLSSRVRIARNIKDIPFPQKLDDEYGKRVVKIIEEGFYKKDSYKKDFNSVYLWEKSRAENLNHLERYLISDNLIKNSDKGAFISNANETVSLMINEEDHIRLQCFSEGFNIRESLDMANEIDDLLEEELQYAFDEKLGYITACPTNIGTGLRASVMIHLPAITMTEELNGVNKTLTQLGMTIRGVHGEGSKAQGNLYQISNQISLGISEEDIITKLEAVVNQVINKEQDTRKELLKNYNEELEDKIFRSLGILKSSVILSLKECMDLLSNVRFGVEIGVINEVKKTTLNKLLVDTKLSDITKLHGKKVTDKEKDIIRAKLVKDKLNCD